MVHDRFLSVCLSLGLVAAVSGCVSNGGGAGGGGAGGGSTGYEAAYDAANARIATTDMPTSLQGTYKGQMKVGVNSGSSNLLGQNVNIQSAEIIGDVDLAIDWTDGMATNPFSGTASGFVATEAGTSNSIPLEGTLTVAAAPLGTISRVNTPSQVLGGITVPEINTGAFSFGMEGQLGSGADKGNVTLLMGGTFTGPGATAMVGTVSGGVKEVGSTNPAIFDAGIGGTFYAVKQ